MSILFINMTGRRLFTAFAVFEPDACSSFGNFLVKQWFWIEPDGISYSVYSGAVLSVLHVRQCCSHVLYGKWLRAPTRRVPHHVDVSPRPQPVR